MRANIPFNIVVSTIYGQMIVNRHDTIIGRALLQTGKSYDHDDIILLMKLLTLLSEPHVVLDIGANVGAYSLAFSKAVGTKGKVHAFEPQRIIFNMLAGTIALNCIDNVFCHHVALGSENGEVEIPQFDYNQPLSFGSIEFGKEQNEKLTQERRYDKNQAEYVRLTTLDSFSFTNVSMIKIDVEGMEAKVLEGASETIWKNRPIMYVEWIKSNQAELVGKINSLDYRIHQHGTNILCVPSERSEEFIKK